MKDTGRGTTSPVEAEAAEEADIAGSWQRTAVVAEIGCLTRRVAVCGGNDSNAGADGWRNADTAIRLRWAAAGMAW